jgi:LDH2 family malate/lactate/ureidoglycolate dehydrogenase
VSKEQLPRGIPDDRPAGDQPDQPQSFRIDELRPWGIAAYTAAGMSEADATTVVDNQLWSDLRGVDTHGFQRVSWYIGWFQDGSTDPRAQMEIVQETPSVVVADGNHGLGQLVITRFMEHLIEVAKTSGLVVGSRRKLFGNNPIVWTFPRRDDAPIVLDMAMTPVALGKVLRARSEGKEIPEAWGFLDRDGNPTVDPDVAMKGIVPAIGGYKGIGMITASNILAGVMSGSAHTGDVAVGRRGQFFLLMNPGVFRDIEGYYDDIENMVSQIRSAGEEDGLPGQQVYLPGEIEQQTMDRRRAEGVVSYPGSVVRSLKRVGDDVGVPFDCTAVD